MASPPPQPQSQPMAPSGAMGQPSYGRGYPREKFEHELSSPSVTPFLVRFLYDLEYLQGDIKLASCAEFRRGESHQNGIRAELDDFFALDMVSDPGRILRRGSWWWTMWMGHQGGQRKDMSQEHNESGNAKGGAEAAASQSRVDWRLPRSEGKRRMEGILSQTLQLQDIDSVVKALEQELKRPLSTDINKMGYICGLLIRVTIHAATSPGSSHSDARIYTLSQDFYQSYLCNHLWRLVSDPSNRQHTIGAGSAFRPRGQLDEKIELALEILHLIELLDVSFKERFTNTGVRRIVALTKLFNVYSRRCRSDSSVSDAARLLRITHKLIFCLRHQWITLIGGEAAVQSQEAQQSNLDLKDHIFAGSGDFSASRPSELAAVTREFGLPTLSVLMPQVCPQDIEMTCSSRHTVRYLTELGLKYPALHDTIDEFCAPLYPFIHPFDGHLTSLKNAVNMPPLPTGTPQMEKNDDASVDPTVISADEIAAPLAHSTIKDLQQSLKDRWGSWGWSSQNSDIRFANPPPKAVRDAVKSHMMWTRPSAIERKYAEAWHRMMAMWGPPDALRTVMGPALTRIRGSPAWVTNIPLDLHESKRQRGVRWTLQSMGPAYSGVGQGALCEADERGIREGVLMGGMVEKEDVVALGAYLDGIEKEQQASTSPGLEEAIQRGGDGEDALSTPDKLYVSLFPHMPEFVAAVVGLVSSWIPLIDEAVDQQRMALKSAGSQASKPSSQKKPQPSTSYSEGNSGDQSSGARSTLGGAYETQNDYTCHRNERGPQASAKVPLTYQTRTAARSRRDSDASMSTLASNTTATDQAHVSSHAAPPRFSKTEATLRRAMYAQCRQVGGLVSLILRALQCMHVLKMEYFGHLLVTNKWITQTLKWIGFLDLEYLIKVPPLAHKLTFSRHSLKFIEGAILRDATARGNATSDSANTFRGKLKAMAATTDILFDPSGLQGLYDMISTLRLLTHRHILRRYLLAHNMGLVFLKKLYGIDNTAFRRLVCEIIKDIFPFERRNWRTPNHEDTWLISIIYLHAPPSLHDVNWLERPYIHPGVEHARMEELLRLIRFYHQHYLGLMVPELALNAASSPFGEDKGDGGETGTEIPGRDMPALVDPSESPRGYHSLAWNPEDRLMDGTEPRVGESALGLSIDDFPTISATISTMSAVTTAMLATTIEYSSTSDGEEPNHLPSSSPSLSSASSLASDMYWDSPLEELYHTA